METAHCAVRSMVAGQRAHQWRRRDLAARHLALTIYEFVRTLDNEALSDGKAHKMFPDYVPCSV